MIYSLDSRYQLHGKLTCIRMNAGYKCAGDTVRERARTSGEKETLLCDGQHSKLIGMVYDSHTN
jgi:hypothetical protein